MWNHYKKSFLFIQVLILFVAFSVYQSAPPSPRLAVALVFFAVMQLCAVIGALWAVRLRRKLEQQRPL